MISGCPGQDKRFIKADIIVCPSCGYKMEIFSDEIRGKCAKCKTVVQRKVLPTCIEWCKSAKECVGDQVYGKYMKNKSLSIKSKLLKELEDYFGVDIKRINHAKKVLDYAQDLLRKEGGDWHIVIPAAIFHDVGIKVAEEKYGSSTGHYQEKEGPFIAKCILSKASFKKEDIEEICDIIACHHSPGKVNTRNFRILYDADWLVNLKDEIDLENKAKLKEIIDKVFLTKAGKEMAYQIYLGDPCSSKKG